jgi:hypothetical protein
LDGASRLADRARLTRSAAQRGHHEDDERQGGEHEARPCSPTAMRENTRRGAAEDERQDERPDAGE